MTACRKISINKTMPTHSWKNPGRVGIIFFANKKDIYNTVVLSDVPCDFFANKKDIYNTVVLSDVPCD